MINQTTGRAWSALRREWGAAAWQSSLLLQEDRMIIDTQVQINNDAESSFLSIDERFSGKLANTGVWQE
jgi:hypothetical protein